MSKLRNLTYGEPLRVGAKISIEPNRTDYAPKVYRFLIRADGRIVGFCVTEERANFVANQLRIHGEIDVD